MFQCPRCYQWCSDFALFCSGCRHDLPKTSRHKIIDETMTRPDNRYISLIYYDWFQMPDGGEDYSAAKVGSQGVIKIEYEPPAEHYRGPDRYAIHYDDGSVEVTYNASKVEYKLSTEKP